MKLEKSVQELINGLKRFIARKEFEVNDILAIHTGYGGWDKALRISDLSNGLSCFYCLCSQYFLNALSC